MKGQTQALTAVLITSVTVGAVATAYIWGTPLLQKRQSQAQLQNVEQDALNLRDEIASVSRSGTQSTAKVSVEVPDGRLEVEPEKNYIDITTQSPQPPYAEGTWTLLQGDNTRNLSIGSGSYGIAGEELPGVVAVRAAAGSSSSVVTYRVEFRNLFADTPTGTELRKVDLRATGRKTSTGETTLLLSNEGKENDNIKIETGETLPREKTVVEIDIQ